MKSRISGGETRLLFTTKLLGKYDVSYYECVETGFIQTEEPYWLHEAYTSAIAKMDIGLVKRNLESADSVSRILNRFFNADGSFIDYGGGYGLFTRLMRDKGFDFYITDKYCENLFAEFYDVSARKSNEKFELLTAFELFEHLVDPLEEVSKMMEYSNDILFSTEVPPKGIKSVNDWWYFVPEIGQHVSFYSIGALEYIAKKFKRNLYTNGKDMHLLTTKAIKGDVFAREHLLLRKMHKYVNRQLQNHSRSRNELFTHDCDEAKERTVELQKQNSAPVN